MKPPHHQLGASDESSSSGAEVLIFERQVLSKAVEELKLTRLAVVEERLKVEDEVQRRAEEENAHRRVAEEALLRSEAERRRLEAEEKALRQVNRDLVQLRAQLESARNLPEAEIPGINKVRVRTHLQEDVSRPASQARSRIEETVRNSGREELRLVEPETRRSIAEDQTQRGLTLGQRLRAEIDGLALAQRKHIDASRAQLNARRSGNYTHASTAA